MSDTLHPFLPPAVPLLHRSSDTLQVGGVDTTDGLLVHPVPATLTGVLRGLDGSRPQRAVVAAAADAGFDPGAVVGLLDGLRGAGLLVDLEPADLLVSDAGPAAGARTTAELPTALARGAVAARWQARRRAAVVIDGATRVGVPLAAMLASSGVGRISVHDTGLVAAGEAMVGGLAAADEGRPRAVAAADAVRRASPLADVRPLPPGVQPDLVVLARPWAASDPAVAGLQEEGAVHLVVTVRGDTGVVGPLVVPGVTSCLRCADLHRRDLDPAWPALAAQLTSTAPPASGAVVTCLLTAVIAAGQVLAYLEGSGAPVTLGATLELRPPELVARRRVWSSHPECGCPGSLLPGDDARPAVSDAGR